jgi:hypothetical protein
MASAKMRTMIVAAAVITRPVSGWATSARVDSVAGREKESESWSPAAWLRPPR